MANYVTQNSTPPVLDLNNVGRDQATEAALSDLRTFTQDIAARAQEGISQVADSLFGRWGVRHVDVGDGRILAIGGDATLSDNGFVGTVQVEMYNPVTNTWTAKASLPAPRAEGDAILLRQGPHAGKVLYIGGANQAPGVGFEQLEPAGVFGDCWLYDVAVNTWTATGSLPGGDGIILPLPSVNLVELNDGRVVVAGNVHKLDGFGAGPPFPAGSGPAASVLVYAWDPFTGTWSALASLNEARQAHAVTLLNDGRILVVGGGPVFNFPPPYRSTAEIYDPVDDTWTMFSLPALTDADGTNEKASREGGSVTTVTGASRNMASLAVLPDGRVLIYGGWGLKTEDLAAFRPRRGCLYLDPGVLLSTGPNVYSPTSFSAAPSMIIAKSGAARISGLIHDGRVMAVAGQDDLTGLFNGGAASDIQFFDPVTQTWILSSESVPLLAAMAFGAQGVITDGRLFHTGSYVLPTFANNLVTTIVSPGDK
jgi:hypothetical protein